MKSEYIEKRAFSALYHELDFKYAVALELSMITGLRIGDVVSLKPENLQGKNLSMICAKTKKPFTTVLNARMVERLNKCSGKQWIFSSYKDPSKHISRTTIYRNLVTACKRNGVEAHISPHTARKIFGVDIYNEKGLEATQKALQHDRATTTLIYALSDKITARNGIGHIMDTDEVIDKTAQKVFDKLVDFFKNFQKGA